MRFFAVVAGLTVACGATHATDVQRPSSPIVFRETFDTPAAIQRNWIAEAPNVSGTITRIEDETLLLELPANKNEVSVRHRLDLLALRGKRVRVHALARTSKPSSVARATVAVAPSSGLSSYADTAATRSVTSTTWSDIETVIDVDVDAATADLLLVLRGGGSAWFDNIDVSIVGEVPAEGSVQLSALQLEALTTFTRVAGYIRYLHPSDQAATLDWDAFLPAAITQLLHVRNRASLRTQLQQLFATIAPTVQFVAQADATPISLPLKGTATHLARWRHFGLGPSGPYLSMREGRDAEEQEYERYARVALPDPKACRSAQLDAKLHRSEAGEVSLIVQSRRPGQRFTEVESAVSVDARLASVTAEIAADTQELRAGVRVEGRADVTLETLSLLCENGKRVTIEIAADWKSNGYSSLYQWTTAKCGSGTCATLERNPFDTEFVAKRDVLDLDIGSGLRMRMPLAVWTDGQRTYPATRLEPSPRDSTIHDVSLRLAAVSATWSTLALFYPYFKDQQTDWNAALPGALKAAASAKNPQESHEALSRLVAQMRDDHARVTHAAAPINGIVPLALRRFGNKLLVVGGLPEYTEALPPGTEVVEVDSTPALRAYDRVYERVSAATPGWHDWATPFYLTVGLTGTFRQFRFRLLNGKERAVVLPLVARDQYDGTIRESRPRSGTEVAPGVYYVDFEKMREEAWREVLPALQRARALIFDLRGYTTNSGMEKLAYLTDRELLSPRWQTPMIDGGSVPTYDVAQWSQLPMPNRLTAPVVVLMDGRSASAVETVLQMIRDNKLAVLVGETSGGTNGNTNTFVVPGDFTVRFTGMRVDGPNGITVQGRGIVPDKQVRPTLEGVRAGRDEILEAGVVEAQRLIRN